jgi:hypothetical protein
MFKLYSAANLQEAHIVLGLLEAAGIDAMILNSNAQGGVGEIPFVQTYPELWIQTRGDLPRARAVVEAFERPARVTAAWQCAQCGEENPGGFELCWKCTAAFAN